MNRRRHSSGSPFEPVIGFSRAVRVGDRILVSGTAPVWPDGSCDPDAAVQARRCLEIVVEALGALGAGTADVVRTRTYLVDARDQEAVGRAHGEVFRDVMPASTMVVVAGLLDPRWRVEIEAEAIVLEQQPERAEAVVAQAEQVAAEAEASTSEAAGSIPATTTAAEGAGNPGRPSLRPGGTSDEEPGTTD